MSRRNSDTSSLEDLPVYFKPFTRESLKAIKERKEEEEIRLAEEKLQKKEKEYEDDDDDEGPCPDPKLEQGCTLPIRLAAAFEQDYANMPLEELDPYYKAIPTFVLVTKKKDIFRFSATDAMWCLSPFNPVRRVAIAVLTHGMFSIIIITTILANCYVMIIPPSPVTESTEVVFTAIYTFESAVKVIARGFILEKFTYLRDAWNWLDFVVISLAYLTMGINLGNLAALRTCRVFRALKTVAIVPGLKTIVGAVIESVKNLRDVIILTVFALSVFGLVGLQIYMGVLTQKCVRDFPEDDSEGEERDINWHTWNLNFTNWYPYPPPEEYGAADYPLCGNSSGSGTCPENYTCLQGYGPNPNYGYTSFDSFGNAFLSAFRLMTQDFWESLYQQILRSAGPWHMLFFIVIIFLGSYYLVNLILAIVAMSYDELQKKAEEEEMANAAEEEAIREEAEARAAKIAAMEAAANASSRGDGGGGGDRDDGRASRHRKSPSGFSGRSYETFTGQPGGGGGDTEQELKDIINSEYNVAHLRGATAGGITKRKIDATHSLPGSPYTTRRGSHPYGKDKLIVLSTYMEAQDYLPYADDSTAATPMSEENGAIILPFCNGVHRQYYHPQSGTPTPTPDNPGGFSSLAFTRHSSYNSHPSRFSSYNSHDLLTGGMGAGGGPRGGYEVQQSPTTKQSQLIQRARNMYGGGSEHGSMDGRKLKQSSGNIECMGQGSSSQQHLDTQGLELKDVMVLNQIIDQAAGGGDIEGRGAGATRPSHTSGATGVEEQERVPLKVLIKQMFVKGCFRFIDMFCLWDCGFPYNLFKKCIAFIVFDAFTELGITLAIVVNTIFMALDHYGLEENYTMNAMLQGGNKVFTTIFTLECSMKIIAMSPKYFFQVGWNVFDSIIVLFSLIEVVFEDANLPGISALRSFRLLRVFKLAKSWPTLNMLISIMGKTVGALSNLVFVLVIIIFIFAVMGMQLFAQNYFDKTHLFPGGEMPRWNFTDFGHSFMIIFRVLCGEWIESMWDCMLVTGGACVPFFLATVVIGNLVLLNLFLALLLSSFGASSLAPSSDSEPNKIAEAFDRIGRFKRWVKNGIRDCVMGIIRWIIRAKNRIVPRITDSQRRQVENVASEQATNEEALVRKKRARLQDTARMVITSKKMMNNLNSPDSPGVEMTKLDGDTISIRSYGSHTHYPRQRKTKILAGSDAEEECIKVEKASDMDMSQNGDDDEEWDEDDDDEEEESGEGNSQTLRRPKEEEEEYPAECMPPRFYERFPIFAVEDTRFGIAWAQLRLKTFRLIENEYFETAVIIMILLSSLALALEDVHLPGNPVMQDCLFYMDRIFTVIFFFEMLIKWLALGFVAYFNNAWCWLDFVIVMVSLINFVAALAGAGGVQAFKTMRTLRALRPLRAMSRMQGMRIVVNALIGAIPSIMNVLLVCLIFWLIFAIMGVQLFNGKFHKCLDPEDGTRPDYRIIRNKVECLANNFTWENSVMNFDHVGKAYLCLFQVATFKGWIGIMNDAIDSREIDDQPHREVSFIMYIYFVIFIIFGSFFTLNLFIGVIIDNFNEQKKKSGGSMEMFMTEDQKKYYAAMQKMGSKKPIKAIPKPRWKPQAIVFEFVTNQKFDMVIMIFIGLNMLTMTMDHYNMSKAWDNALGAVNSVFVAIFTGECLLKIFAHRYHYFTEPWNLFDLVVVFMSVAGMLLSDLIEKYFVSPTLLRVVRVAKVGRVLRLVKGAKGIRTLLFALAMSLPALFNICLLLFLVMFIFSIFGMSFFMNVKLRGGLDDVYNFQTFGQSIILLFQMSTSAGWDGVLDGIMDEEDCDEPDPEIGLTGNCGNTTVGIAFLLSYLVMTFLIIINMYVAVILENYSQATEEVQEGLTDDDYDMYYEIWAQFDPDGCQYIKYDQLSDILDVLEPPLQIHKPNKYKIISMDIPICKDDMMYCVDILDALTKDFFARKGNPIEEAVEINDVTVIADRPGYEPVSSTLWRQREDWCARLVQAAWRRYRSSGQKRLAGGGGDDDGGSGKGEDEIKEVGSSVVLDEESGALKILISKSTSAVSDITLV